MKFPKLNPGDLLVIKLKDITAISSWLSDEAACNLPATKCAAVGWFIGEDKKNIRLSFLVAEDGDKTAIVIPKGIIDKVRKIKYERF